MIKKIGLIGYTGLVGSNILNQIEGKFEDIKLYNSKNIKDIKGEKFDLLIIAGVSGNKSIANFDKIKDAENIAKLASELQNVKSKETVLISTIDIFNENSSYYGINRKNLELNLKSYKNLCNLHILRLPGLFGNGLKKNVIYDIKNLIPPFLKVEIFNDLSKKDSALKDWYKYNPDKKVYEVLLKNETVKKHFIDLGFTSLNFSNINSDFYWFNLNNIWKEISNVIDNNISEITIISDIITNSEIANICNIDKSLFKSDIEVHYKNIKIDGKIKSYFKDILLKEIYDFVNDTSN